MTIYLDGHTLKFEIENICRMFFPFERVDIAYGEPSNDRYIYAKSDETQNGKQLFVRVCMDGQTLESDCLLKNEEVTKSSVEYAFAALVFPILTQLTTIRPAWGLLTGIRPVKLLRQLAAEDGLEEAANRFRNDWLVTENKVKLALETERYESEILRLSKPESFSLYLSIPFCPSRCRYCSFVSHSIEMAERLLPDYIELMCKEIEYTAQISSKLGLKLETVYMGGGTPTTLNAQQLERVLSTVVRCFDMSKVREFTVEAGRPDTITKEKLEAIKRCSVKRISINPQTLNPSVLKAIGRNHTVEQFMDAYSLAREVGFECINVDLIAGLPDDNFESFKATIDEIVALNPENITLHTLSIKRAADLSVDGHQLEQYRSVGHMIDYGSMAMGAGGYHPYYLYRQKNTAANLENTGFCLDNKEGLYNVFIMDETHTILAVGAGGVTKLKNPVTGKIERIFNYKYPYEYINGFDEILRRKDGVADFYKDVL